MAESEAPLVYLYCQLAHITAVFMNGIMPFCIRGIPTTTIQFVQGFQANLANR